MLCIYHFPNASSREGLSLVAICFFRILLEGFAFFPPTKETKDFFFKHERLWILVNGRDLCMISHEDKKLPIISQVLSFRVQATGAYLLGGASWVQRKMTNQSVIEDWAQREAGCWTQPNGNTVSSEFGSQSCCRNQGHTPHLHTSERKETRVWKLQGQQFLGMCLSQPLVNRWWMRRGNESGQSSTSGPEKERKSKREATMVMRQARRRAGSREWWERVAMTTGQILKLLTQGNPGSPCAHLRKQEVVVLWKGGLRLGAEMSRRIQLNILTAGLSLGFMEWEHSFLFFTGIILFHNGLGFYTVVLLLTLLQNNQYIVPFKEFKGD